MPAGSITAEPSVKGAPPAAREHEAGKDPDRWRRYAIAIGFLAPALVFLGIWVVYPTIYTIIRSFCDRAGTSCVGIDNYKALFTTSVLLTTIKNTAIWVLVVPALHGHWLGVRRSHRARALVGGLEDGGVHAHGHLDFAAGVLSGAMPSTNILQGSPQKGLTMRQGLHAGQVAQLGLTGIPASDVAGGDQAAKPATVQGGVSGVV